MYAHVRNITTRGAAQLPTWRPSSTIVRWVVGGGRWVVGGGRWAVGVGSRYQCGAIIVPIRSLVRSCARLPRAGPPRSQACP